MTASRGIRNNNPLNIRRTDIAWKGKVAGTDPEFETFQAPEWGIRAGVRNLQSYQEQHDLNTLRGIIARWAPPAENDTGAYLDAVSTWSGIAKDEYLDLSNYETTLAVVRAMCRMENGRAPADAESWYPLDTWEKGLRLAGLSPSKPLAQSRTMKGTTVAGGAASIAGTALLAQMLGLSPEIVAFLPDALDGLTAQQFAWLMIGISVAGNLYAAWARKDDKTEGRL
jgi:hypothetical protein